jgi:hypothetical protein
LIILRTTGNFLLVTITSFITAAVIRIAMQISSYAYFRGRDPLTFPKPSIFKGSIWIGSMVFPAYQLFVILVGVIIFISHHKGVYHNQAVLKQNFKEGGDVR